MVSGPAATLIGALCGVILTTTCSAFWTQRNESLKRRKDERDALQRCYGPLLWASKELQHRIWDFFRKPMSEVDLTGTPQNPNQPDLLDNSKSTWYFFGQIFAWDWAIRNVVNEMGLIWSYDNVNSSVRRVLNDIATEVGQDPTKPLFRVISDDQWLIGEAMLKKDSSGNAILPRSCIDIGLFLEKLSNQTVDEAGKAFQKRFNPITTGITSLSSMKQQFPSISQNPPNIPPNFPRCKLRRIILFHDLLVDLIRALDFAQQGSRSYGSGPIRKLDASFTEACTCEQCEQESPGTNPAPRGNSGQRLRDTTTNPTAHPTTNPATNTTANPTANPTASPTYPPGSVARPIATQEPHQRHEPSGGQTNRSDSPLNPDSSSLTLRTDSPDNTETILASKTDTILLSDMSHTPFFKDATTVTFKNATISSFKDAKISGEVFTSGRSLHTIGDPPVVRLRSGGVMEKHRENESSDGANRVDDYETLY